MRPAQKSNRARGRGNRKNGGGGGGNNINRVYESAGPEGKVRGTPQQIVDKYLSLARDSQTSGDRVTAENFLQHAEHYQRILLQAMGAQSERRDNNSADEDDESESTLPGTGAQPNGTVAHEPAADEGNGARGPARQAETETPRAESAETADDHGAADVSAPGAPQPETEGDPGGIGALATIDAGSGEAPSSLLVETEEIAKSQPRRRRSNGRAKTAKKRDAETEGDAPAAEAPAETSAPAAESRPVENGDA
ncbi:MAG: DUF4167 domain-containing protein [Pseudomonadota bacterium]